LNAGPWAWGSPEAGIGRSKRNGGGPVSAAESALAGGLFFGSLAHLRGEPCVVGSAGVPQLGAVIGSKGLCPLGAASRRAAGNDNGGSSRGAQEGSQGRHLVRCTHLDRPDCPERDQAQANDALPAAHGHHGQDLPVAGQAAQVADQGYQAIWRSQQPGCDDSVGQGWGQQA